jgi:tetratricopeptide (TPR) repeat protein
MKTWFAALLAASVFVVVVTIPARHLFADVVARIQLLQQIMRVQPVQHDLVFDLETVRGDYWSQVKATYQGDTEKPLAALASPAWPEGDRQRLAGLLGVRFFDQNSYKLAASAWQYLASRDRSQFDTLLEQQARHYEVTVGDRRQAERYWQMWLALSPEDWTRYERVAEFYERGRDLTTARQTYAAGEQVSSMSLSHYLAGRRLELDRQWPEALAQYTLAIERSPDFAKAYTRAAYVGGTQLKQFDQAIALCQQSIRLTPGDYFCYELLARFLHRQGQPDAALVWLDRGIEHVERTSYQALFHALKGDIHLERHDFNLAEAEYQTAITLQPVRTDALIGLAQVYEQTGRAELALRFLARAFDLRDQASPPVADWYAMQGRLYENLEKTDLAIAAYQTALSINAADELTQQALARLLSSDK